MVAVNEPRAIAATSVSASRPVDVARISGHGTIHRKKSWVAVKASVSKASNVTSWYVDGLDVYRGDHKLGSVPASEVYADTDHNVIHFQYHTGWGRGTLNVRHIKLNVFTSRGGQVRYSDNAAGTFDARSMIRGGLKYYNIVKFTRHGGRLHVAIAAQYYSPSGWRTVKWHVVYIQEAHNGWKTVKKIRTNHHGKASWYRSTRHRFHYRIKIHTTHALQGGHSATSNLI